MRSQNTAYLARLDSLRFIAASMVLLFHANVTHLVTLAAHYPALIWLQEGHRGVNLFFALSGFLFAVIVGTDREIVYKNFILNRFLRIFPLLIFTFLITAGIYRDNWDSSKLLGLAFIQLYLTEFQSIPTLGTAWTISTEFLFYLLFPFLHLFTNKYGERYLLACISLFIIMRFLSFPMMPNELGYFFTILGRFDILLIGMLTGRLYLKQPEFGSNYFMLPLAIILLTSYFLALSGLPHSKAYLIFYPPVEAALWSFLIVGTLNSKIRLNNLEKYTAKLGGVSYSLYLLHPFVIVNCEPISLLANPVLNSLLVGVCIILPLTTALAFLSFYVIEKPFLDFRVGYFK